MPYFKKDEDSKIVEYTEEFAEQVLRPQGKYIEVEAPKAEPVQVSKKKAKKSN